MLCGEKKNPDCLFSVSLHELELTGDSLGLVPYLLVLKQHYDLRAAATGERRVSSVSTFKTRANPITWNVAEATPFNGSR